MLDNRISSSHSHVAQPFVHPGTAEGPGRIRRSLRNTTTRDELKRQCPLTRFPNI